MMADSILNGKRILVVDDEPDVLDLVQEEILEVAPKCQVDTASNYEEAAEKLESQNYELVILDIMGVRGFDLLSIAVSRNLPVAMLTAHALNPEALKKSMDMKARAYLPKEKLGEIVPFLEDVLEESDHLSGWGRMMGKLEGFFNSHWGADWQKPEAEFWREFERKTARIKL
jgi:DNA-binding NtrC family response regulator